MAQLDLSRQTDIPGTTKGDLIVHDGADYVRLAVGANGLVLKAASAQASGLQWASETVTGPAGADTQLQFNASGSFGADSLLIWDNTAKRLGIGPATVDARVHASESVDGDLTGLLIENSQAADAGTNETAALAFGFGGVNDAAQIKAVKDADFQVAADEDSGLEFWVLASSTPLKALKIDSAGDILTQIAGQFVEFIQGAAPSNPAAGSRRLFVDSADGKLKVRTSGGANVSLEEQDTNLVTSVFTRTGAVVAASGDYTAAQVTNAFDRSTNNDIGAFYIDTQQIVAPANPAAGTRRLFVDSADGKLKVRTSAGANVSLEESSGAPGGANTQVQFNDSGAFGGDADLTWDKTNNILAISGAGGFLDFGNRTENTLIRIFNGGGTADYGIGLQSQEFRFFVDTTASRFEFGVSSSFTSTVFTIDGTGRIAVNSPIVSTIGALINSPGVDGDAIVISVENDQSNVAASTNESAVISFAFGGWRDTAWIRAGKEGDYVAAADRDSFLSFHTEESDTLAEQMRIDSIGDVFVGSNKVFGTNESGFSAFRSGKVATIRAMTEWDIASANASFLAESYSGVSANVGGVFRGVAARGTHAAPTATQSGDLLFRLQGRGYDGSAITSPRVEFRTAATENWTGTATGTEMIFQTIKAATTTLRNTMILRGEGILEVDADADGDVVRIKQGGTQEGQITVSGTTVAYEAFTGAHPTQLKVAQDTPPLGALLIATGQMIQPELRWWEHDRPTDIGETEKVRENRPPKGGVPADWVLKQVARGQMTDDVDRFSRVAGTTTAQDKQVYGVYIGKSSDDAYGRTFGRNNDAIHSIASLGLYMIRVTDTAGNIQKGDYLTSSTRIYEAQRQADDILHSYTAAKALVDVDWAAESVDPALGYKWKLIPATLHCG